MQHGHVAYGCGSYTELLCTRPRWPLEIGHARPTLSLTTLIADRPVHYPLHTHTHTPPRPVLSIKLLKLVSLCILWSVLTPSNITGAETCQAFLPATLPTTPRGLGP